jgi:hypothetical protein
LRFFFFSTSTAGAGAGGATAAAVGAAGAFFSFSFFAAGAALRVSATSSSSSSHDTEGALRFSALAFSLTFEATVDGTLTLVVALFVSDDSANGRFSLAEVFAVLLGEGTASESDSAGGAAVLIGFLAFFGDAVSTVPTSA